MLLAIKFVLCLFLYFLSTQATNQKWPRTFVCAKNCISVCWFLSTHSCLRFKLYYHMKRIVVIKSGVYSFFKHIILKNVHMKCYIRWICWSIFDIEWYSIDILYLTDSYSVILCFVNNNTSWCLWQKPSTCP